MKIKKYSLFAVLGLSLALCSPNAWSAVVYDIAADWSDVVNPNGVWSYNDNGGNAIATNVPDWDPTGSVIFGSPQKAWAATPFSSPNHVPMWFQRTSDSTILDIPIGGVGMHGAEGNTTTFVGVNWTSPFDGNVDITGGVWQSFKGIDGVGGNHTVRNADWRIRLNNTVLTGGNVSGTDLFTSLSPFDLLAGSDGAVALTDLAILTGDVITLEFISPTSFAQFVGVDFTVTGSPVPIPAAFPFFLSGLAVLGFARSRKKNS